MVSPYILAACDPRFGNEVKSEDLTINDDQVIVWKSKICKSPKNSSFCLSPPQIF
jgi:hypothetical protein